MKKVTLFVVVFVSLFVTAQETKKDKGLQGAWFATSQFGYQSTEDGSIKSSNLMILPVAGTFITPSIAVGAGLGYINVKNENGFASGTTLNSSLYVIQPLARKYWNITGGLYFFGQLAAPIITGKESTANIDVTQYGLAASGGFDIFLSKHFSVEFSYMLANLSVTKLGNYPGTSGSVTTTNFALASVASIDPAYNRALFGSGAGIVNPLSFGFKFIF